MADIPQPETLEQPAQLPILYSFRRCPYAIRARMALAVSGTPHELREVVLCDKPPGLRSASPKNTVPVLVLPDGKVIDESLDIMLWALDRHDPQRWLGKRSDQQGMLALIAQCDGPFKQQLDAYKYPAKSPAAHPRDAALDASPGAGATAALAPPATTADLQTAARQQASAFVQVLNDRLSQSAWLWGAQMSLADAAVIPFVRQFAGVQPDWFVQTPWHAVRAWLDAITASALFTRIMQRPDRQNC